MEKRGARNNSVTSSVIVRVCSGTQEFPSHSVRITTSAKDPSSNALYLFRENDLFDNE